MDIQTVSTTISNANQTAVPSQVRRKYKLTAGSKLLWKINPHNDTIQIRVLPKKLGTYMRGLGKEVWKGIDVDEYIREGRQDRTF